MVKSMGQILNMNLFISGIAQLLQMANRLHIYSKNYSIYQSLCFALFWFILHRFINFIYASHPIVLSEGLILFQLPHLKPQSLTHRMNGLTSLANNQPQNLLHFCQIDHDSPCTLTPYQCLSNAIRGIKDLEIQLDELIFDTLIFLIGQKGQGKTTLLNYCISNDYNFIVENSQLDIKARWCNVTFQKHNPVFQPAHLYKTGKIGNLIQLNHGRSQQSLTSLLGKVIVENQVIKHVKGLKVVFVVSYDSLEQASFNQAFHEILKQYSSFVTGLKDMSSHCGFVVTRAPRNQNARQIVLDKLRRCDFGQYTKIVQNAIENEAFQAFSKPSQQSKVGDYYKPPSWNINQRQKIVEMTRKLSFCNIQTKNILRLTSTQMIKSQIQKGIEVIEKQINKQIATQFVKLFPVTVENIHSEEFSILINNLNIGYSTSLTNFMSFLKKDGFFQTKQIQQELKQLTDEIMYLNGFINSQKKQEKTQNKQQKIQNWIQIAGLQDFVRQVKEQWGLIQYAKQKGDNKQITGKYIHIDLTRQTSRQQVYLKEQNVEIKKQLKFIDQQGQKQFVYQSRILQSKVKDNIQEQNKAEFYPTDEQLANLTECFELIDEKSPEISHILCDQVMKKPITQTQQKQSQKMKTQLIEKAKKYPLSIENVIMKLADIVTEPDNDVLISQKSTPQTVLCKKALTQGFMYNSVRVVETIPDEDKDCPFIFDNFQTDPDKLEDFSRYYRQKISNQTGLSADRIIIKSVTKGSIKVEWITNDSQQLRAAIGKNQLLSKRLVIHRFFEKYHLSPEDFSTLGNINFHQENKRIMTRGGWPYYQPIKCKRYGIKVKGLYDRGCDLWLGMDGKPGEWAVAFHGIRKPGEVIENGSYRINKMMQDKNRSDMLKALHSQAYAHRRSTNRSTQDVGKGIYCTPHLQQAFPYVDRQDEYGLILQCRVNPKEIKVCENGVYWVINESKNIRPYGIILIKQDVLRSYPSVNDQYGKKFVYADFKDQIEKYTSSY